METFFKTLEKIEAHNKRTNETYELGLTEDADLTYEEQKEFRMGVKRPTRVKRSHATAPFKFSEIANFTAPKSGETFYYKIFRLSLFYIIFN